LPVNADLFWLLVSAAVKLTFSAPALTEPLAGNGPTGTWLAMFVRGISLSSGKFDRGKSKARVRRPPLKERRPRLSPDDVGTSSRDGSGFRGRYLIGANFLDYFGSATLKVPRYAGFGRT